MGHRPKRRIAISCTLIAASLAVGLTACGDGEHPLAGTPYDAGDQVDLSVDEGSSSVEFDKPFEINVTGAEGRITDVVATDAAGRHVQGELTPDGARWRSTAPLAAGVHYTVRVSTQNSSGAPGRRTLHFGTRTADSERIKRLRVTFGPDAGTYGVGQPIVAELNRKVENRRQRRTVERGLKVESFPRTTGSWHWVDDRTLHYRPDTYWPVNATVTASATLRGIKIRDGLRGAGTKPLTLSTGDRIEAVVDVGGHSMTVKKNGETLRTIPVTTGKAGFRTRNGIKVILGKQHFVRMTSGSIGIAAGSSESYDLPVYWNARLTHSGEFVHAAPWSVGSQGAANVSHGCTGLSTANARWFYKLVRPGDIVKYVNGEGSAMPVFGNGYGDWNMPWKEWRRGSAFFEGTPEGGTTFEAARLRPEV